MGPDGAEHGVNPTNAPGHESARALHASSQYLVSVHVQAAAATPSGFCRRQPWLASHVLEGLTRLAHTISIIVLKAA